MVKHLFRVKFTNPKSGKQQKAYEKTESFKVSDEAISRYLDVHVLEVPFQSINYKTDEKFISVWGRDNMTEWGNALFIKPRLSRKPFGKMLRKLGYQKDIEPNIPLSEGGCYVFGDEFILISDIFEKSKGKFEKILHNSGLEKPAYFVPDLTHTEGGHIDCDYQIIDSLKLIYGSGNVFCNGNYEMFTKARKTLEEIAKRHNYDMRKYESSEDKKIQADIKNWEKFCSELGQKHNGINSIVHDGKLFTGSIHPEEKEYLQERGMDVITVPLGKMNVGSGLRCVYGEFNLD
ncbi:MAG: hypothetical protein NTY20_06215 [Candidatus Aenigmarchaeota archaeon]|nr:hypothetical protein [Candidatus Aenigmarchaeota archaeon]